MWMSAGRAQQPAERREVQSWGSSSTGSTLCHGSVTTAAVQRGFPGKREATRAHDDTRGPSALLGLVHPLHDSSESPFDIIKPLAQPRAADLPEPEILELRR